MDHQTRIESLCGDALFWDNDLSWNSTAPKLTRCFHQTILNWLPTSFLWLFAFYELTRTAKIKRKPIPWNFLNRSRLVLTLLSILINIIQLFNIIYRNFNSSDPPVPSDFYAPLLNIASFTLITLFLYYHRLRGVHTSAVIWIYIFLQTIGTFLISYQTWVDAAEYTGSEVIIFNIYFVTIALLLIIVSFSDGGSIISLTGDTELTSKQDWKETKKALPESNASFLNHLVFWWFNEMAFLGWKQDLTYKDLWELRDDLKTENLIGPFETRLEEATLKAKKKAQNQRATTNGVTVNEKSNGHISPEEGATKYKVNFIPILAKIFGFYFVGGSFFKLFHDIFQFITPQLLKSLISFIESKSDEPIWHGFLIAFAMFAVSTTQSIFLNHYFYRMFMTGMQVSSTLTAAIYKKSLNLSDKARKEVTSGEIVNLMAVDAKRFLDLIPFINLIWSAPFQISVSIYFLYLELGYSAFFGLAVMILMIPLNGLIAGLSRKMQIQLMKQKDERVKFMNEILSGIKIIKFYGWEKSFLKHVTGLRNKELNHLKNISYLGCATSFLWICAPTMVSVITFAAYVLIQGETLTAQKAFVSLSLFNILRFPLTMLPQLITFYIMASVSVKRINNFLSYEDLDRYVTRNDEIDAVSVEDAYFKWGKQKEDKKKKEKKRIFARNRKVNSTDHNENGDVSTALINEAPTLQKINMKVKPGSFVAIVGSVGSGKSSLLSALLGEMEKISGRININGKYSIAYVAQQAWIQNATLKDNILFGKPLDESKYNKVLSACALEPDIAYLPGGDETEIGEKGINLSGGQKQRVSLARACYSDSDLFILDDPLSAVDAHVAQHIFKKVLSSKTGILRNKTRVLVTNKLDLLSKVDSIYVLTNGQISENGTYKELMEAKGEFSDLVEQFTNRATENDETEESVTESVERKDSVKTPKSESDDKKKKLIEAETSETGKVKWSVYLEYFRMVSFLWIFLIIISLTASNAFSLGSNIWLSSWSSDSATNQTLSHTKMRLGVYGGLGIGQGIVTFIGSWFLVIGTLKASSGFHRDLLYQIFRSPMSFFDTTPTGRIVNRFAKDIDTVDAIIPQNLRSWLLCFFQVLSTFVIISFNTPLFIAALVPISAIYGFIQRVYVASSRQLKRLESVTRSPIYSHFGETLNGVSTIRAFDASERFMQESAEKVDHNLCCYYPNTIANRWLGIRLEFCGNLIIIFAATFAVLSRNSLDGGEVGLSVSYALSITATLNWLVRMSSELETNIVAVERIMEYCKLQSESDWYVGKVSVPDEWPEKGSIKFDNYQTRYREGTELVLRGISCEIKEKEKVGIVGRTGAGKSTVTLSLFRLIEASGGCISIDGVNISDLPLHPLRSRLAIIPQDPVLFGGTLRFNLDPFDAYSDEDIWDALSHAHLKGFVNSTGQGLNYQIAEEGKNLSVGQRQLLCLARALLKKPKILFLDEATAAIDLETDSLIQKTIRTEFKDCTILTIAHRLNTILDSDRVLVLDHGLIAEFDTPKNLLDNKESIFYSLAKEANLVL